MRRRLAALAAAAALGVAESALAAATLPLCRASMRVEPAHAVVGEQLIWELRILRRRDVAALEWDPAPSFPAFRAEWLPGSAREDAIEAEGESWLAYTERRALFPAHAGVLEIPAVGLRCQAPGAEEIARAAGLRLPVEPVPEAGRPPAWTGVVGPLDVTVTAHPRRVPLGETVRLSVVLRGPANLWDAEVPLTALEDPDVELFVRPPELARDAGRRLTLRRYFSYELVPRDTGLLRVPALEIPWFDARTRRYAVARTRPLAIEVVPRPIGEADAPAVPPRGSALASAANAPAAPSRGPFVAGRGPLVAAAALVLGSGLALLGVFATRAARRRRRTPTQQPALQALAEAEAAARAGEREASARAAGRALRGALALHVPGAHALAAEELLARSADAPATRAAAELLLRLERARFAGHGPLPDLPEVRQHVERLT